MLGLSAANPVDVVKRPQCHLRGLGICRLGVVIDGHTFDASEKFHAMRQSGKGFEPPLNFCVLHPEKFRKPVNRGRILPVVVSLQCFDAADVDLPIFRSVAPVSNFPFGHLNFGTGLVCNRNTDDIPSPAQIGGNPAGRFRIQPDDRKGWCL